MTLKLILDRYEENIAVCLDDEAGKRYLISKNILGEIKENDIFTIEYDGESFYSPVLLTEETAKKRDDISKRMKKIFNMSRHRRPPKL